MPMNLKVTGIAEACNRLTLLQQVVRDDFTRRALKAAAEVIAEEQRSLAPVLDEKTANSDALEPGALRAGIGVRIHKDGEGYLTALIGPKKGTRRVAHSVEYGHLQRVGPGGAKTVGHVPAHPFLRPAFDAKWQQAVAVFALTMKNLWKGVVK